ncbi:MAG: 2-amino-4-hydroxy-6-hydroxymethyldihydropteridine diphosphokinase [Agitococcus sp.]
MTHLVYLGLGANLGQPIEQLQWAVKQLQILAQSQLQAVSRLYGSKPAFGSPTNQPDYVNAVVLLQSTLSPAQLLSELQQLEQLAGRIRLERWGARTLDLDILLYDQQVIETKQLTIPHKELMNRCFVTLPLLDINPTLTLPNGVKVSSLACATLSDDIHVIRDDDWWKI